MAGASGMSYRAIEYHMLYYTGLKYNGGKMPSTAQSTKCRLAGWGMLYAMAVGAGHKPAMQGFAAVQEHLENECFKCCIIQTNKVNLIALIYFWTNF